MDANKTPYGLRSMLLAIWCNIFTPLLKPSLYLILQAARCQDAPVPSRIVPRS
jgi:hypothetical protein